VARARRSLNFGDSYTCTYCLQVIHWDHHRTRPTRDHFFPKSKKKLLLGAKTTFIICCQSCNSRKSDKVFSSIEEVREFITSRKRHVSGCPDRESDGRMEVARQNIQVNEKTLNLTRQQLDAGISDNCRRRSIAGCSGHRAIGLHQQCFRA